LCVLKKKKMNAQQIIQQLLFQNSKHSKKQKHVHFENSVPIVKQKYQKQFVLFQKTNIDDVSCFAKNEKYLIIGTEHGDLYVNGQKTSFPDSKILDCTFSKQKIIFSTLKNNHELQIHCHGEGVLFTVENIDEQWPGGGLVVDKHDRLLFGVGQKSNVSEYLSISASQVNEIPISQVNEIPASQDNRLLYGKIARIHIHTEDNPKDNPFQKDGLGSVFRNEILHNGLRNPKRLHFDEKGYLWVTDSGNDINMNENIFKLDQPSNCRWDYFDGFKLIHTPSHESVYVLHQATPHASYQSPQNENPLDALEKIGSCATGGIILDNEAYLFADQGKLLSLEPEINMDKVISQNNDVTIHDDQDLIFVDFVKADCHASNKANTPQGPTPQGFQPQGLQPQGPKYKSEKNIKESIFAITKNGDIYYLI